MKNFWTWVEQRNSRAATIGKDTCPVDLLLSTDHSDLFQKISLFISETGHTYGSLYPLKTLYQLLFGMFLYMKSQNPAAPNFLDRADHTVSLAVILVASLAIGIGVGIGLSVPTESEYEETMGLNVITFGQIFT